MRREGMMQDEIRARAERAIKGLLVVKCMENCQHSTVGSIITALESAGLEIVAAGQPVKVRE